MKEVAPEVKASETIHHLVKLLWRVESLQAIGLNYLLQLGHQPLPRCSVATKTTYSVAGTDIGDTNNYSRHCPCRLSLLKQNGNGRHRCIDEMHHAMLCAGLIEAAEPGCVLQA